MVETTLDLSQVSCHEFLIKPDFDEELQGMASIYVLGHSTSWSVIVLRFTVLSSRLKCFPISFIANFFPCTPILLRQQALTVFFLVVQSVVYNGLSYLVVLCFICINYDNFRTSRETRFAGRRHPGATK